MTLVDHQSSHLSDVPDMMLVGEAIQRLTGFWITLIRQVEVVMDGVVAAPPQTEVLPVPETPSTK